MARKFDKAKLTEIVVNMFSMNEVMFIYYCGSDNYKTKQKKSDTDLTVVLKDFNGIIHASIDGVISLLMDMEISYKDNPLTILCRYII